MLQHSKGVQCTQVDFYIEIPARIHVRVCQYYAPGALIEHEALLGHRPTLRFLSHFS